MRSTEAHEKPVVEATLREYVARGEIAGLVALAWRPGQPTRCVAIGRRDVQRDLLLDPLGMRDTAFVVPHAERHRRAALTGFDDSGHLTTLDRAPGGQALAERPDTMTFESGGGGLWSTADDYLRFARLFVGGGAVDGCRGGVGTVGWPGAYGGWWQADPNDGSVLVVLSHNMVELSQMAQGIGLAVWSAIADFQSLA